MILKTFSATLARDREVLGDSVTGWIRDQGPNFVIDEVRTHQSSDQAYHCLTIIVFGHKDLG